ncbi:MAG: hypothetical protein PHE67_04645 [Campylobacterales bacterium]|nr:hypothetical protein [Campylobacterales bacterium]
MDIKEKIQSYKTELMQKAIEDFKDGKAKNGLSKALSFVKSEIEEMVNDGLGTREQIAILGKLFDTEIKYQSYVSWYNRNMKIKDAKPSPPDIKQSNQIKSKTGGTTKNQEEAADRGVNAEASTKEQKIISTISKKDDAAIKAARYSKLLGLDNE